VVLILRHCGSTILVVEPRGVANTKIVPSTLLPQFSFYIRHPYVIFCCYPLLKGRWSRRESDVQCKQNYKPTYHRSLRKIVCKLSIARVFMMEFRFKFLTRYKCLYCFYIYSRINWIVNLDTRCFSPFGGAYTLVPCPLFISSIS